MLHNAAAQERKPGVTDIPAMQVVWAKLKAALTGPNGEKYWEAGVKGAELPYLYETCSPQLPRINRIY